MNKQNETHDISITGYLMGFILAMLLTLLSFIPVMQDLFHQWTVSSKISYLLGLAIIQIFVQVFYFLHLHHGPDAKWNLGTFGFGVVCVTIIIGGTWSAIQHLNYNMMGGSGRIVTPPLITITAPAPVPERPIAAVKTLTIAPGTGTGSGIGARTGPGGNVTASVSLPAHMPAALSSIPIVIIKKATQENPTSASSPTVTAISQKPLQKPMGADSPVSTAPN